MRYGLLKISKKVNTIQHAITVYNLESYFIPQGYPYEVFCTDVNNSYVVGRLQDLKMFYEDMEDEGKISSEISYDFFQSEYLKNANSKIFVNQNLLIKFNFDSAQLRKEMMNIKEIRILNSHDNQTNFLHLSKEMFYKNYDKFIKLFRRAKIKPRSLKIIFEHTQNLYNRAYPQRGDEETLLNLRMNEDLTCLNPISKKSSVWRHS